MCLRHIVKVHAVNTGDQCRHRRHRSPRRYLSHIRILLQRHLGDGGIEQRRQAFVVNNDPIRRNGVVIQDVPIQRPNTLTRGPFGHRQRFEYRGHGVEGVPHLKVLPFEHVNRLDMHRRIRDEHLVLHGVHLFFEFLRNMEVIVDKPVQMGIRHRRRPNRRQLRRTLKPVPNIVGNGNVAVSDGEDEILAPDDMQLISLNEFIRTIDRGRVVMNRARDDENIITQEISSFGRWRALTMSSTVKEWRWNRRAMGSMCSMVGETSDTQTNARGVESSSACEVWGSDESC